jgi:hypothetical protein
MDLLLHGLVLALRLHEECHLDIFRDVLLELVQQDHLVAASGRIETLILCRAHEEVSEVVLAYPMVPAGELDMSALFRLFFSANDAVVIGHLEVIFVNCDGR